MNYKKIIRSRNIRMILLSLLNWIPDCIMIPLQYKIHTGRKLNLKNPKRFTEKLQLYKLKYHDPDMLICTDKYEVRKVVKNCNLDDILVPLVGIYNSTLEIEFERLPNQFVAKTTDGGGGNQIFICRDKTILDKRNFMAVLDKWMKDPKPKKSAGREWAYENGFPRRIIIEEFLSDNKNKDIVDYKFWCFNGNPEFCQVIGDRSSIETIDFFDMNWNHIPMVGLNPKCMNANVQPVKPEGFDSLKDIARKLSKKYPFVRVDLYNVNGIPYFGELTFYPASGYGRFTPDDWDEKIGDLFEIHHLDLTGNDSDRLRKEARVRMEE